MSSTTESQIKYAGDGVQVLFTFPFTYLQSTDIYVSLYNETERRWDDTTEWTFANATTIQFTTAPPTATGEVTDNIRIQRRTSVDPLVAQFNPGSAIRASDLNDDFEQLQLAVIDNSSLVTNIDVGVTSIIAGEGISVDQATGNVTVTSTATNAVTSVNGQTGAVALDINDLTDVVTEGAGHIPADGQALVWDSGMSHWMPGTVSSSGDGIPEAPVDNKVYGRENATWVVVADGETGPVLSVNHQTGAVKIGVEELEDFAYYPASEQVTLLGPCVGDAGTFSGTEYTSGNGTNGLYFVFPKTNTQVYDILSELTDGDPVTVCFYSSVGTVYTELETTFTNIGNNGGTVPSWFVQFGDSVPGAVIGDYPTVFKSSFITNGQAPITTGQTLIYDQTTEKWRPEDVSLNIGSLPTLP
jgi:hypothetical protein